MLIELLLVIVLAAVLFYLGLERYRAAYRSMQFDLVQSDVVTIRQALNHFYNAIACDTAGVWQGPLDHDVINELETLTARAPDIKQYHAYIRDSGAVTLDHKPLYQLEVTAQSHDDPSLLSRLAARWQATRYDQQTLYWVSLPNNTQVEPNSRLWVMNASLEQFRHSQNHQLSTMQESHAYCFR